MNKLRFRLLSVINVSLVIIWFFYASICWIPEAIADESVPRTVAVHLFEWKWPDIAKECETFLGPKGFAAVQVSPPNEHAVINEDNKKFPWYQRYQPVSYKIQSRSGTEDEFADMVKRCQAVGVDVYVDAIINHMTGRDRGVGSAGSSYEHYDYPGLYSYQDFHHCGRNGNDDIKNYNDKYEVQNCELLNLADLDTSSSYVQGKIVDYLNHLIDLGVAGFRFDASKHMDTNEIQNIVNRLKGNPYIYQEVIEAPQEPIKAKDYFKNGDVTEFQYSKKISQTFFNGKLAWLERFGEDWGFMPSMNAIVFVDNHDNQRGHGSGGHIVTHKDGTLYDLANVFMLAWPYGYPRIMSSYDFTNEAQGPPSDAMGRTNDIYINGQPNCFKEWKCEHRWRPIANMVAFHNYTSDNFFVTDWWTNGNNQIAFGRGDKGFVVINREGHSLTHTFQTSLPKGEYCNMIDGELTYNYDGPQCTGSVITVDHQGQTTISMKPMSAIAIYPGSSIEPPGLVDVNFSCQNGYTQLGTSVYVVGNTPKLGNWSVMNVVQKLDPTSYPTWTGTLQLPSKMNLEWKCVKALENSFRITEWQRDPDTNSRNNEVSIDTLNVSVTASF